MTLTQDRHLQTGIAGSLIVHALLLLLLVAGFSVDASRWHVRPKPKAQPVVPEEEVALVFADQILPVPPPPIPKRQEYIRTTQNKAADKAPAKPAFASDRNTVAASEKAPAPDATVPLPTMDGIDRQTNELLNRDQRDGDPGDDNPTPSVAAPAAPLAQPQMLASDASTPSPILKPVDAAPVPSASPPPTEPKVAKLEKKAEAPLAKMMEEMDREAVRLEVDRLPLEVRKPDDAPKQESPPQKQVPNEPAPAPVPAAAALREPSPVEPVPTPSKGSTESFSPFTRTSAVKGTISNRGQSAVDAERTPMGVYMRSVTSAVERRWHLYRKLKKDAVTFGSLKVRFFVTDSGKPEDLKIISDPRDADPRMADFTLRAIQDAEIPPIPADLLPMLEGERVMIEYDVLIY